jgi:tetratricopeptide (TPR) repeat protein
VIRPPAALYRCAALVLLVAASAASGAALGAQSARKENVPPRPRFQVARDSNSAASYYYHGMQVLGKNPAEAADAFWWASRLEPEWADPVYARRVALIMKDESSLIEYVMNGRRTSEQKRADSLQTRALLLDPFLYRKLDKEMLDRAINSYIRQRDRYNGGTGTMPVFLRPSELAIDYPRLAGWMAYSDGKFADALKYFAAAMKRYPKAYDIHSERADVLFLVANYDSTLAELGVMLDEMRKLDEKKLIAFYDSKAFVEYQTGKVHVARGDLARAREAFGRALTEDLSFYMAHAALSGVALAQHDTATAIQEYDLAVQLKGDDPGLRYQYGAMLFVTRKYDAAAEQFAKAIELDPDYAKPYFPLAYIHDGNGRDADAARYYDGFVSRAPAADEARVQQAKARLAELRASAAGGGKE